MGDIKRKAIRSVAIKYNRELSLTIDELKIGTNVDARIRELYLSLDRNQALKCLHDFLQ